MNSSSTPNGPAPVPSTIAAVVAHARDRIEKLPPRILGTFGVIGMWHNEAVAEHENISRLRDAAELHRHQACRTRHFRANLFNQSIAAYLFELAFLALYLGHRPR